jgi:hypothetical protein
MDSSPRTGSSAACPAPDAEAWERHLEQDRSAAALSDELLRRCLRRLAEAWDDLNYRHLRSRLKPPSIQLHESERRWGACDSRRRLITISKRQVLAYTWESVLETLKHEMAHQFVSEALDGDDEPPHGRLFREACRMLQTDPSPRGDGGVSLLRPGGAGARASADDARLLKIQKLLALADNNPDEHEAKAAFARASELMLKYNLGATQARPDLVHRTLGESSGRVPHHHYLVASILQRHFFVQCIWVDSYTAQTGVRGHVLEVMGTRANVDMAEYVHACLLRQGEALWKAYKQERRITDRRAKREYLDGLLNGFRRQLEETSRRSQERGLIWVGDPQLDAYVRRRHPRTTTTRLSGVRPTGVRADGVAAGSELRLRRPLEEAAGRGRRLPGPRG